jgi:hypothetical protein
MGNKMTFFSGTDINTLRVEGNDRNHFVSLIVNNAGVYSAAITRKVTYKMHEPTYHSFDDVEIKAAESIDPLVVIEYFPLDVTIEGSQYIDINNRIDEIKREKAAKPKVVPYYGSKSYGSYGNWDDYGDDDYGYHAPIVNNNASAYQLPNTIPNAQGAKPSVPSTVVPAKDIITTTDEEVDDLIDSALKQLLTGSIAISSDSKINFDKWTKTTMVSLFDKRFGNDEAGLKVFEEWAELFIEFILWHTSDDPIFLDYKDQEDAVSAIAELVLDSLNKLTENKYTKIIKNILDGYTFK